MHEMRNIVTSILIVLSLVMLVIYIYNRVASRGPLHEGEETETYLLDDSMRENHHNHGGMCKMAEE